MRKTRTIYFILAIVIGIFLFIYGGMDDSPGAQLIGFIATVMGIVGIIKKNKKT